MRAEQNEVCLFGTYGRIYESPLDTEYVKRERPARKVNAEVLAWRLGRRKINPATEFNLRMHARGPCIAMTNVE